MGGGGYEKIYEGMVRNVLSGAETLWYNKVLFWILYAHIGFCMHTFGIRKIFT